MKSFDTLLLLLLVCIIVNIVEISSQSTSDSAATACNNAKNCTECMAMDVSCNWCIQKTTLGWTSSDKRCNTYEGLISTGCMPDNIKNITTQITDIQNDTVSDATDGGRPAIQVQPQRISIKLRPNEKKKIPLKFRLAQDYPVDLYYLMDLSQSMGDDKDKVANLGISLAEEMRKITKDVRLGFGSFVDKVLMPYVNTLEARLESPCSGCEGPYSFKHRLTLTEDTSVFGDRVNGTQISGNLDGPEGGFDALMQAMVCNVIGWRNNSRKMLIFSTDDSFHSAGDGKLGGVVEPNDGLCHMTGNEYTWGTKQDYPSISQIASKVAELSYNVIFAVTKGQTERYQALSDIIPGSVTGELYNDSSNIVKLVKENYEKISSKVVMTTRRENRNEALNVKLRANCEGKGIFSEIAECGNLGPGDEVSFEVEVQATSCAPGSNMKETFEIYPTGLTESLRITAEVDCACTCGDTEPSSALCEGVGTYECGVCECGNNRYGETCQCDIATTDTDFVDFYAPCKPPTNSSLLQVPCSGRGECVCGKCENCDCLPGSSDKNSCKRFTGLYCQCNPDNCPRNSKGICSNQGKCQCNEGTAVHYCQCDEGFTGSECECPISNQACIDPETKLICNGQGPCECGVCRCEKSPAGTNERYTGQYCEECSTCVSQCPRYKQCVQCYTHEKLGWDVESYDEKFCLEECTNDEYTKYTLVAQLPDGQGFKSCGGYTSANDDCTVKYSYKHERLTGYEVYIKNEKECPFKPNILAIILGVIGGIVLIGIVALLIWRLVTTLHDRREFAKFEKEKQQAQWKTNENPIYVQATSTFKNPMYNKGEK